MMPNMDGYEVCRRLKADPRTAGIPVIFLTARTQDDDEELGLKLGAVDYTVQTGQSTLRIAREIAYSHHEKWDGGGYPEGQAGDDIPIAARLMTVADVYDALISRRVYKPDMPHQQAVTIIMQGKGNHFDPDLVDAFLDIADQFQAIARRFADDPQMMQDKLRRLEAALVEETIVLGG